MTLAEFLLARVVEDEDGPELHARTCSELCAADRSDAICDCDGPQRWAAECEAKRRIVERLRVQVEGVDPIGSEELWPYEIAWDTLCFLALPYADHPDYREEWKP